MGSVTGSLDLVGGVRKAEREEGRRRGGRGSRDVVREVESTEEVNGGEYTRETRKRAEVRHLIKTGRRHDNSQRTQAIPHQHGLIFSSFVQIFHLTLYLLTGQGANLPSHKFHLIHTKRIVQVGVQAGKPTLHHYLFDPTKDAVFEDPPER